MLYKQNEQNDIPQLAVHDMIHEIVQNGDRTIYHYDEAFIRGKTIQYEIADGIWGVYHDLVFKNSEIEPLEPRGVIKMNYCISGRCEFHSNKSKVMYMGSGDFIASCLKKQYEGHRFPFGNYIGFSIVTTEEKLSAFMKVFFPRSTLSVRNLIDKINRNGAFLISGNDPKIHDIFEEMLLSEKAYRRERSMLKLAELVLYLIGDDMITGHIGGKYFDQHIIRKVKKVKTDVTKDLEEYMKIEDISTKYNVSQRAFADCFKAVYGKTYYAFIKEFRIKKAAEMLRMTDERIGDIAMAVGYQNPSKFSKAFSDVMGVVPIAYRKNHSMAVLE